MTGLRLNCFFIHRETGNVVETTQWHVSRSESECMLVLKGHRLCIACLMAFKGLMLHHHLAFFPKRKKVSHIQLMRKDWRGWDKVGKRGTSREKTTGQQKQKDWRRRFLPGDGHTWLGHGRRFLKCFCAVCIHVYIPHTVSSQSSFTDGRSRGPGAAFRDWAGWAGERTVVNMKTSVLLLLKHSNYIHLLHTYDIPKPLLLLFFFSFFFFFFFAATLFTIRF